MPVRRRRFRVQTCDGRWSRLNNVPGALFFVSYCWLVTIWVTIKYEDSDKNRPGIPIIILSYVLVIIISGIIFIT